MDNKSEDGLLMDWGLHHIHFIPAYTPKKRTNEILFIMERPDKIYFVDIFAHGDWVKLKSLVLLNFMIINREFYSKIAYIYILLSWYVYGLILYQYNFP